MQYIIHYLCYFLIQLNAIAKLSVNGQWLISLKRLWAVGPKKSWGGGEGAKMRPMALLLQQTTTI